MVSFPVRPAVLARSYLTDIPRIPDSSGVIFRLIEARDNEIRLQPTPLAAKPSDRPPGDARTRRFSSIKAHLCRRRPSHLTRPPVHAGARGARTRAIRIRISLHIRSHTPPPAIPTHL